MNKLLLKDIENKVVPILQAGGVGVLPTDTIYGIVGSALIEKAVKRIYKLRRRDLKKPMIVLIASMEDLRQFNIHISQKQQKILTKYWPGSLSVVFAQNKVEFEYLHRGTNSMAIRLPKDEWLRQLLKKTGPLVAPSANLAGQLPASNYAQAKKYFGNQVDFYVDDGEQTAAPSTLVSLSKEGNVKILRQGSVVIT